MMLIVRFFIIHCIIFTVTRSQEVEKHYQYISKFSITISENDGRSYKAEKGIH